MNIPVICAAGNSGDGGVNYPAAFDETIAVAAYDKYGKVARFSSKGEKVEWAAPGVNVYSTYLNNGYASLSGTSMACPFIAGVVALMLSKHKKQEEATGMNDCKTIAEIREHLLKYTNDKGAIGRDNSWGYGVIDVERLIGGDKKVLPTPTPTPTSTTTSTPTPPPTPTFTPTPTPTPKSKPPVADIPKKKKNTLFIVLGVIAVATIVGIAIAMSNKVEIPEPPYWDKNGEINWDKKFELERK